MGTALSLAWRVLLAALDAPTILLKIGTIERADALLWGCAAALALRLGWRPKVWMLIIGIAVIAVSPFVFNRETNAIATIASAIVGIGSGAVVVGLDYAAPT